VAAAPPHAICRTSLIWVRKADTTQTGSRLPRRGRLTPPSVMLFGVSRARADGYPKTFGSASSNRGLPFGRNRRRSTSARGSARPAITSAQSSNRTRSVR
jgi:hypothetical protein